MTFHKKLGQYYKVSSVILLNTSIAFLLINLLLFVFYEIEARDRNLLSTKYIHSLEKIYPDLSKKEIIDLLNETVSRPFVYDPITGFREHRYNGKYVNVDENGFRITKDQGPWPPDRKKYFTVFVFGGSTTFGYSVSDHQTIPSYLQEFLSTAGLEREPRVYNFGQGNYYSTRELILFEKLITSGFIPDMAIFIDGLNEFFVVGELVQGRITQRTVASHYFFELLIKLPIARAALSLRNRVSSFLRKDKTTQEKGNTTHNRDAPIKKVIDRYTSSIKIIDAVANVYDIKAIFVWQPIPTYKYDLRYHLFAEGGFGALGRSKFGYLQMAEFARHNPLGNNFLWCADMQESITEPLYVDKWHYSAKMSRKVARYILDLMIERDLLSME